MLQDFKSVSVRGAQNIARARVLWRDGWLRIFEKDGTSRDGNAGRPVRRAGFRDVWDIDTDIGPITLKAKCVTCGGRAWWRIMRIPANELWEMKRV